MPKAAISIPQESADIRAASQHRAPNQRAGATSNHEDTASTKSIDLSKFEITGFDINMMMREQTPASPQSPQQKPNAPTLIVVVLDRRVPQRFRRGNRAHFEPDLRAFQDHDD